MIIKLKDYLGLGTFILYIVFGLGLYLWGAYQDFKLLDYNQNKFSFENAQTSCPNVLSSRLFKCIESDFNRLIKNRKTSIAHLFVVSVYTDLLVVFSSLHRHERGPQLQLVNDILQMNDQNHHSFNQLLSSGSLLRNILLFPEYLVENFYIRPILLNKMRTSVVPLLASFENEYQQKQLSKKEIQQWKRFNQFRGRFNFLLVTKN